MRRLAERWQRYRAAVVPADAGAAQVKGTELAFYGGAVALFHLVMNILDPGTEATEKDLRVMSEIDAELRAHTAGLVDELAKPTMELYTRPGDPGFGFELRNWYPTPDASGQPTMVHLLISCEFPQPVGKLASVIRFKSAEGIDRFVADLQRHRREVWP